MKMNELLLMIIALLTGAALGSVFFGGLWLTIRQAMASKIPVLWFLGSFVLRTGIVLAGFYFIMQSGNWQDGLICLIGFISARFISIRLTKAYEEKNKLNSKERKEAIDEA
ncbi:MAG: F1F0 ATPase subunit 2 [Marivirga sp.]|jgi:F1F0 ATPase subunit 2